VDLQDVYLDWHPIDEGELATELIVDAQERISSFRANSPRISGFETSNFHAAARVLQGVKEQNLAPGIRFCELGCGFGVVTCLASMLGYEAYGIEIEQSLLEGGISLASDYNLGCHFVLGSYRPVNHINQAMNAKKSLASVHPKGGRRLRSTAYKESRLPAPKRRKAASRDGIDHKNEKGAEPTPDFSPFDFDLVYAYPWPAEIKFLEQQFSLRAKPDSLYVAYLGGGKFRLQRK